MDSEGNRVDLVVEGRGTKSRNRHSMPETSQLSSHSPLLKHDQDIPVFSRANAQNEPVFEENDG